MKAGSLRHAICIQKKIGTQDESTGAMSYVWRNFATVRASIQPLSAREFIQSDSTQSQIQCRIVIRHIKGLKPTMRLVHGEDIYNPHGFLSDPKSGTRYITIPCSLGVNKGE